MPPKNLRHSAAEQPPRSRKGNVLPVLRGQLTSLPDLKDAAEVSLQIGDDKRSSLQEVEAPRGNVLFKSPPEVSAILWCRVGVTM